MEFIQYLKKRISLFWGHDNTRLHKRIVAICFSIIFILCSASIKTHLFKEVDKQFDNLSKNNFRNDELLTQHYEKHGAEVGASSKEEYVKMANSVIASPNALHKNEQEDNDKIYFIENTGEIVFVSGDGYIRTYFITDIDYYNRQ